MIFENIVGFWKHCWEWLPSVSTSSSLLSIEMSTWEYRDPMKRVTPAGTRKQSVKTMHTQINSQNKGDCL